MDVRKTAIDLVKLVDSLWSQNQECIKTIEQLKAEIAAKDKRIDRIQLELNASQEQLDIAETEAAENLKRIAELEKAINKAIDKIELWGNVTEAQEIIKQALTKGKGGK